MHTSCASEKNEQTVKNRENRKKGYPRQEKRAIIYKLNYAYRQKGEREMKRIWRYLELTLTVAFAVMLLSGCGELKLSFSPQDLYCLPALPAKYTELNSRINEILNSGAEYAAPTSGANIQSVQLVDLNGDGREEALAFFRNSGDEKPMKIYIFGARGDTYEQIDLIEGSGTAIYSIDYQDLDGDGQKEIAVGWKAATELQVLEVYALGDNSAEMLLRTNYVRYTIQDMNRDQRRELIVLQSDEEGGIADYYGWQADGGLVKQSSARLSVTMAELSQQGRVTKGCLRDDVPAVFVTGVTELSGTVTDVLALRNGELSNIVLSEQTGVSKLVHPFCGLYPMDINNDGLMEVPSPARLPTVSDEDAPAQRIDWLSYDEAGGGEVALRTYHCVEDGWYLQIPEPWTDHIYITRSTSQNESGVTFYTWEAGETPAPILRITAVTGANREINAVRGNRFLLSRQTKTLYTAELLEGNDTWQYGVTADEVRAAFSLIQTEWIAGDN